MSASMVVYKAALHVEPTQAPYLPLSAPRPLTQLPAEAALHPWVLKAEAE